MRRLFLQALFIFILALLPMLALWWKLRSDEPVAARAEADRHILTTEVVAPPVVAPPEHAEDAAFPAHGHGWETLVREATAVDAAQTALESIGRELERLPQEVAVSRILAYLESMRNRDTGLRWRMGAGGRLESAPTLRVWLIDWLGRLDPAAAAGFARGAITEPKRSADEWALHLRNFAWGEEAGEPPARLAELTVELLEHEPWRAAPTPGFQHAFDVLVYAEAVGELPRLLAMLPGSQPGALQHPANLAIENLIVRTPASALQALSGSIATLDERPRTRAGFFARAQLADREQRAVVENYFLDEHITAAERDYFLQLVPNLNVSISRNLLTETTVPTRESYQAQRRETASVLRAWSRDPRFRPWRGEIDGALERLDPPPVRGNQ